MPGRQHCVVLVRVSGGGTSEGEPEDQPWGRKGHWWEDRTSKWRAEGWGGGCGKQGTCTVCEREVVHGGDRQAARRGKGAELTEEIGTAKKLSGFFASALAEREGDRCLKQTGLSLGRKEKAPADHARAGD